MLEPNITETSAQDDVRRAGVYADKILMKKAPAGGQRMRQAVGVSALTAPVGGGRQFRLEIRAKYVVSSAGSLHTPALLLRSKITCKGNVGRHLHLHPATAVIGLYGKVTCSSCLHSTGASMSQKCHALAVIAFCCFPTSLSQVCACALQEVIGEKMPNPPPKVMRHTIVPPLPMVEKTSEGLLEVPEVIETWKGSIFSIYSNKVADWEGSGYGALLETPSVRDALKHPTRSV